MYPRTRNTRETWTAVTNHSLSALIGAGLAIVLVPVVVLYLAAHPVLGVGVLLGIGLSHLLSRLTGEEPDARQQSNDRQLAEKPVWFEGLDGRQRTTGQSSSD